MNRFIELNGLRGGIYGIPQDTFASSVCGINSTYGFECVFQTSQIRVSLKPPL
ncbi:hypothetical protein SAMN04487910_1919 [Aquimarina amphilecti]|uniref:Uncharacterized protein n=1 Tax=Aquimarina amphilecti TaxID=1038014 RepID=A0A1H7N0C3_AQUAM|nr:hypothetical protein SAMN04487910_1919 [Aquimarina amphilecti]